MMDEPKLTPQAKDHIIMGRAGLSIQETIRQHEFRVKQYKSESNNYIKTDQPTYLISGTALCQKHRTNFKLVNWMKPQDLKAVQEAARTRGLHIPNPNMIPVEFKPLDWKPHCKWMELER
jgi:hypothetical protein